MSRTCFYVVISFDRRLCRECLNRSVRVWGDVESSDAADGSEFERLAGLFIFYFFQEGNNCNTEGI